MAEVEATGSVELVCPRCGVAGSGFSGCPRCRADGVGVNLVPPLADLRGKDLAGYAGGPWGWAETLPVGGGLGLGEGNTPNVPIEEWDGRRLWVKDESRNPTGSHKDRAMTVGVAAARAQGGDTVVAASSGNAGVAAAAFAARAGLRCVVLTTTLPAVLAEQIRSFGAALVGYADTAARNRMMEAAVTGLGWYPLTNYVRPVVGANPYAIEGYKSIAYELARDLGPGVEAVVVPTSAADLLAGAERGYRELAEAGLVDTVPHLVAAETATGAAFSAALGQSDRSAQERTRVSQQPSPAFSIGNTTPTWQGLNALWRTGGTAIALAVDDYMAEHRRLPATTGLYLEPASAVAVLAARQLLDQGVGHVVALGTGSGLKALGGEISPPSPPTLAALADHCENVFAAASARPG